MLFISFWMLWELKDPHPLINEWTQVGYIYINIRNKNWSAMFTKKKKIYLKCDKTPESHLYALVSYTCAIKKAKVECENIYILWVLWHYTFPLYFPITITIAWVQSAKQQKASHPFPTFVKSLCNCCPFKWRKKHGIVPLIGERNMVYFNWVWKIYPWKE